MSRELKDLTPENIGESIEEALKAFTSDLDPTQFEIGQEIDGKGFYVGTYTVKKFRFLSKTFDLYAAPEYLNIDRDTYEDAYTRLNNKKGWHGFDGEAFFHKNDLIKAFKKGAYRGGWFIPTFDMINTFIANQDKFPQTNYKAYWDNYCNIIWSCDGPTEQGYYAKRIAPNFQDPSPYDACFIDNYTFNTHPFRAELRTKKRGPK